MAFLNGDKYKERRIFIIKESYLLIGVVFIGLISLMACTGPEGPTGPTGPQGAQGPAGPGNQTVYNSSIIPSSYVGYSTINCAEIKKDSNIISVVTVYTSRTGYSDWAVLPFNVTEADLTVTSWWYSIETGKVYIFWLNSSTTIPLGMDVLISVINK